MSNNTKILIAIYLLAAEVVSFGFAIWFVTAGNKTGSWVSFSLAIYFLVALMLSPKPQPEGEWRAK